MTEFMDDDIVFTDEEGEPESVCGQQRTWRILVVDDDQDVHEATEFALNGLQILERPLTLLHAHSGKEALAVLARESDIAVILLDVVMESDDAGLKTVDAIRNELKLVNTRIILRTGQPGQAPEASTIARYDINDYKTKSELNQNKLYTALTTAIRSYDQLLRLDASRHGLEKIVSASNELIGEQGLQAFADGVITQIAALIGVAPDGVVCAQADETDDQEEQPALRIIAAAGHFKRYIRQSLNDVDEPRIVENLTRALVERRSLLSEHDLTLYFRKNADQGFAAYINTPDPIDGLDQHLLEVFCTNIALCAKNVDLVTELRRDACFDRQVGLPNRLALINEVEKHLPPADPDLKLVVVDVDQFAAANDVLGHQYGDALLKVTARRLRSSFGPAVEVARLGGDAFALLGPGRELKAKAIHECFAEPFVIEGVEHSISVCTGQVHIDAGYTAGAEVIKDGYVALRRAKAQGMGQSVTFSRSIGTESRERAQLLRELRLGFDNQQLFLVFQPQIELATGKVLGAEALLRWRHPDGNLVPPDRFIPIAEQSGLIVSMGHWLTRVALHSLQRFRSAGHPDLRMAINISPVQLRQPGFTEMIRQAMAETGTAPENLELEITESVAVGGLDTVIPLLQSLRDQGISIAIDDFGTGYSSLAYLERLPANRLKIDRSFVLALDGSSHGSRITRTIILLGSELGMKTIAEGIEDKRVAEHLLTIGCDEAQGYHFGKPMSEADFLTWLRSSSTPT